MNNRFFAAARRMSEKERRLDRGAYWRSIHGTLSHLLWADHMWMSRFADWKKPSVALAQSDAAYEHFEDMDDTRKTADSAIASWAAQLTPEWISDDQAWYSGAIRQEVRAPRGLLLAHFYNHQTHHRGQIHAMLTAQGEATGETDLWLILRQRPQSHAAT